MIWLATVAALTMTPPPNARYIGAEACRACHVKQFASQSRSGHAHALHRADEHPLSASFVPVSPLRRAPRFTFAFFRDAGQYKVQAFDTESVITLPIEWAFGAGNHAVTFVSRIREDIYLEHAFTYYAKSQSLSITPGHEKIEPSTLHQAVGLTYPTEQTSTQSIAGCFQCHSTGPFSFSESKVAIPAELGVRCEACHGPGSAHRDNVRTSIENPGRLSPQKLNEFCGNCHRFPGDQRTVNWDYPWNVRHQPPYFQQSACFRQSKTAFSCLTCHDPHEPVRRDDDAHYNRRCQACHHERLNPPRAACAEGSSASCVNCHMPAVPVSAELRFVNHWIGVYAAGSLLKPISGRRVGR